MKPASYDVIIVGSGLAAITTALSLPKDCQVLLMCKGEIADTSSRFAQGGIAAVIAPTDSVQGACDRYAHCRCRAVRSQHNRANHSSRCRCDCLA